MTATIDRNLENRTRQTVNGKRCRVGNVNHPFHTLYKEKGWDAVYEAMGLVEKPTFWQKLVKFFTA